MKNKYPKYLILLFMFTGFACEDILEKEPIGRLDANTYFKTASNAIQAVNAAYGYLYSAMTFFFGTTHW